jgi:hypothetical protein
MLPFLALAALLPLASAADRPAPEISAESWVNQYGQTPSLAALRGRAVLIERWATW